MREKLAIKGKKTYIDRLAKHLKKEHPSTRHRMKVTKIKARRHKRIIKRGWKLFGFRL